MHTPAAREALDALCDIHNALPRRIFPILTTEILSLCVALIVLVENPLERDVLAHHRGRKRLRHLVAERIRLAEHARRVLDRVLRFHHAVRDDLRDLVVSVAFGHILEHLAAAAIVEVHVEVGHGHAIRVEEALEEKSVRKGVEIGNSHRVRHHRARTGATARSHADTAFLRPADEVGDDEEVSGKAHARDDANLVVGAFLHFVGDPARVTLVKTLLDFLHEPGVLVLSLGNREARHVVRALRGRRELHVAHFGDPESVIARLG